MAIHHITGDVYFQMVKGVIYRIPKTRGEPLLFASNIGDFQSIVFNKKGTILFLGYRTNRQIIQITADRAEWKNP